MNTSQPKNKILVAGLFSSGSSSVVNLLKENREIGYIPKEFNDFRSKGLVYDYLSNGVTEEEFLENINTYVDNKTKNKKGLKSKIKQQAVWLPKIPFVSKRIREWHKQERLTKKRFKILKQFSQKLCSCESKKKSNFANDWINTLGRLYAPDSKYLLLDQPILYKHNMAKIWPNVFAPYKMIIVYRNPKDQIADLLKRGLLYYFYSQQNTDFDRINAIKAHIESLKKRVLIAEYFHNTITNNQLIMFSFEQFIQNHEKVKGALFDYLGLSPDSHIRPETHFNLTQSAKNIGIYKQYLQPQELKLFDELEKWYLNKELTNPFYKAHNL